MNHWPDPAAVSRTRQLVTPWMQLGRALGPLVGSEINFSGAKHLSIENPQNYFYPSRHLGVKKKHFRLRIMYVDLLSGSVRFKIQSLIIAISRVLVREDFAHP